MNKIILLVLFFTSVAYNYIDLQQQVEASVKKFIIENADDPSGFQVVQAGKVQKFMTDYTMTDDCKLYLEITKIALDLAKSTKSEQDIARTQNLLNEIDSLKKVYKPYQYGWKIYFKYRIKDYAGKLRINEDTFYLNKKLRVVNADTIVIKVL